MFHVKCMTTDVHKKKSSTGHQMWGGGPWGQILGGTSKQNVMK